MHTYARTEEIRTYTATQGRRGIRTYTEKGGRREKSSILVLSFYFFSTELVLG